MPVNYKRIVTEILPHLQNNEIKTFDIIYQPEESDTSPVICIEHNLGIESWCVKDSYFQAYKTVFQQTPGTDSVHYDTSILVLLLLNPDIKTLWNKRRKSTLAQKTSSSLELNFTKLVLTRKPKCQDALNYRKWLLKLHHLITYEQFVSHELDLILDAASRHENNHVVWDYGIWFLNSTNSQNVAKLCVELWDKIGNWISTNVSDYSALHFRQFLIEKLTRDDLVPLIDCSFKEKISKHGLQYIDSVKNNSKSNENLIIELHERLQNVERNSLFLLCIILVDFKLNENLISFYHNHEALWNHKRFLCYYLSFILPSKLPDRGERFSNLIIKTFSKCDNLLDANHSNLFEFLFSTIHYNFLDKCEKVADRRYYEKYIDWLKKYKIIL